MKRKVSFYRDGLSIVGNLFTPDDFNENVRYRAIIVQGSFSSVKEQMAGTYAQKFANEGFVALTFDYSHYGESEGNPRQLESPAEKLKDLEAAVSYLTDLPFVASVSMVGVCTTAGNAAYLAAHDGRVKSLATVAAFLPDPTMFSLIYGEAGIAERRKAATVAKLKYEETGEETTIPAYSEVDQSAVNFGPAGFFDYYVNKTRGNIPEWKNEFNVMSWDIWLNFDPVSQASTITIPTIVVHSDGSAFPDQAKKLYSQLKGDKELVWSDGTHYDYYDSTTQIDNAVKNVIRFFKKY